MRSFITCVAFAATCRVCATGSASYATVHRCAFTCIATLRVLLCPLTPARASGSACTPGLPAAATGFTLLPRYGLLLRRITFTRACGVHCSLPTVLRYVVRIAYRATDYVLPL